MLSFRLPDIGEGLSEAELLEWLVEVGDTVTEGQLVAVISTDKVNVELPSPAAGVIRARHGEIGEILPVGTVLLEIEDGKSGASSPDTKAEPQRPSTSPAPSADPNPPARPADSSASSVAVRAAPITRRRAAELGVDLAAVTGTGPEGQILMQDVEQAAAAPPGDLHGRLRLSGARLAAARRLAEAARTLATTTMSFEAPGDAILSRVESFQASDEAPRPGPLTYITLGVIRALKAHPHFNASIRESDQELLMHRPIHLGLAVTSDEGLLVPVIRDVGDLEAEPLTAALADAAERARAGRLGIEDVQGSTFTLSSTGGLEQATLIATSPVINLPNVATLWVSRIRPRPRVVDGRLEAGPMLSASLSFDHRFIHGADGTAFINSLVEAWQFQD